MFPRYIQVDFPKTTLLSPAAPTSSNDVVPTEIDSICHGPFTTQEKDHRQKEGLCMYCGQHFAVACPNKKTLDDSSNQVLGLPFSDVRPICHPPHLPPTSVFLPESGIPPSRPDLPITRYILASSSDSANRLLISATLRFPNYKPIRVTLSLTALSLNPAFPNALAV